jgi:ElaB/YqjD/DUF883 family membrane-anchored ribosome-binding protein
MDQSESQLQHDIEETRTAMNQKIEMIQDRVYGTVAESRSTVNRVMGNFKRVQQTVIQAKSTVDHLLEPVDVAMNETAEPVKYATELIHQVNQNPWLAVGSAVLMGYILGSLASEKGAVARAVWGLLQGSTRR